MKQHTLPLYRPWWLRLALDAWLHWRPPAATPPPHQPDYRDLAHLSEDTLRDIGAPDWMHERGGSEQLRALERARW